MPRSSNKQQPQQMMRPASAASARPRTAASTTTTPFNKENNDNTPQKAQKTPGRDIFGTKALTEPRTRARQAFSAVNTKQEEVISTPEADPGCTPNNYSVSESSDNHTPPMTKEEIEALLATKMKGKSKFDFKGKSEQMGEYIKKLRACIRQFQDAEASHISEKEQLQSQLLEEQNDRKLTETMLRSKQGELEQDMAELRALCSNLEDKVSKMRSENEALLLARENDAVALERAEKEQSHLLEELDIARKDRLNANQQIASLQDVNKRLQEYNGSLQLYNNKLQNDATIMNETLTGLQTEKAQVVESLEKSKAFSTDLEEQLNNAKALIEEGSQQNDILKEKESLLHSQLQQALEDNKKQTLLVELLNAVNRQCEERLSMSTAELEVLTSKVSTLEESCSLHVDEIKSLQNQLDITNDNLHMAEKAALQHLNGEEEQRFKVEDLQRRLDNAEAQIREGDLLRKKLHNAIQELKGNIRVFCRVRPLLPDDDSVGSESPVIQYPGSMELSGRGIEVTQCQGQKHSFVFDKVFGPESGQEDVFAEVSQLIQSALDGYKVCIFAYGQTGSGKTHTMIGDPDIPDERGVIPRSLEQLFKASQNLGSRGWSFRIQVSMLEIYNETIRDLLAGSKVESPAKPHAVRHDTNGDTLVLDLTVVDVTNWEEVSSLLYRASQSRAVGKTVMNEQSSRSHCVFTLRISGFNEMTEEKVQGVLNLIDLAGSERLSRSCSTGERLRETQAINKSLASLGDVIMAIANKEQHVPYRNSKLTYLLQPCLGGDSKTLMFVNISPDPSSVSESLCSLRFAAKVNACEMDMPRRHAHQRSLAYL